MNIERLRKEYEEKINSLLPGNMIYIEEKLLEKLLFHVENNKKYLVWSGNFLRKIDLSKIDFSNVEWNINYKEEIKDFYQVGPNIDNRNVYQRYNVSSINLSKTNASVCFDKKDYPIIMENCDFSNVDLSYSNFNCVNKAKNCNFSNTNIEFLDRFLSNNFIDCNFSNNNFNGYDVKSTFMNSCNNFYNTGLVIIHSLDDYLKLYEKSYILDKEQREIIHNIMYDIDRVKDKEDFKLLVKGFKIYQDKNNLISKMIRNNYLDGCYINKKRIYLAEEREEIKSTLQEYYKIKR